MKTQKQVQVIARYQLKRNGHVVYTVRSSSGQDTYTTTLVNGKATGCSCPCQSGHCYHKPQLEAIEARRQEAKRAAFVAAFDPCLVA